MEPTDYPASMELDSYAGKSGVQGSIAGYKGNVRLVWTGEGKMMRENGVEGGGVYRSDLAIWVGPLTLVPHLVFSLELSEGERGEEEIKLLLDYVPREDIQYTTGNNHLMDYFAGPAQEVRGVLPYPLFFPPRQTTLMPLPCTHRRPPPLPPTASPCVHGSSPPSTPASSSPRPPSPSPSPPRPRAWIGRGLGQKDTYSAGWAGARAPKRWIG